jgi:outer membrane protein OmpA-like peptidoglycan-associated protein
MKINIRQLLVPALMATSLFVLQGCLATRDWVKEQVDPVSGRVAQGEQRLDKAEGQIGNLDGRMSGAEGKLGQLDGRIGQVDAKTERALNALANLRLERRFVIDMKEGANFAFNSSNLPAQAKKEIDGFMSDLKGDTAGMEGAIFLIAGHTDNVGSEDYNYELGKRRADAVSRYLMTQRNGSAAWSRFLRRERSAARGQPSQARARIAGLKFSLSRRNYFHRRSFRQASSGSPERRSQPCTAIGGRKNYSTLNSPIISGQGEKGEPSSPFLLV